MDVDKGIAEVVIVSYAIVCSTRGSFMHKHPEVAWRDKDALTFVKLQLLVTLFRQINFNQVASVSSGEFEVDKRADRVNMVHNSGNSRRPV